MTRQWVWPGPDCQPIHGPLPSASFNLQHSTGCSIRCSGRRSSCNSFVQRQEKHSWFWTPLRSPGICGFLVVMVSLPLYPSVPLICMMSRRVRFPIQLSIQSLNFNCCSPASLGHIVFRPPFPLSASPVSPALYDQGLLGEWNRW